MGSVIIYQRSFKGMPTVTDTHSNRTLHSFLHRLLLEAGRVLLSSSSVAASTMSSEESPMSARARTMALARAILEQSLKGPDGIFPSHPPIYLLFRPVYGRNPTGRPAKAFKRVCAGLGAVAAAADVPAAAAVEPEVPAVCVVPVVAAVAAVAVPLPYECASHLRWSWRHNFLFVPLPEAKLQR